MPKIRDLGINTIPLTMRPPEIGEGGGHEYFACGDHSSDAEKSCLGQNQTSACGASCGAEDDMPDESSGCSDASCGHDDDKDKDKDKDKDRDKGGYKLGAFHPEAIAQLRQQLEQQIGQ